MSYASPPSVRRYGWARTPRRPRLPRPPVWPWTHCPPRRPTSTCKPCKEVNGRWLGNISDLDQTERHPRDRTGVLALYPDGAYGGYIFCLGGVYCRGTVTGVWRPKQVGPNGEDDE